MKTTGILLFSKQKKLLRKVSTILKPGVLQTQGLWDGHGMSLLEYELWAHVGPLARVHCQNLKIPVDARWIVLPKTQLGPFAAMELAAPLTRKKRRVCSRSPAVSLTVMQLKTKVFHRGWRQSSRSWTP